MWVKLQPGMGWGLWRLVEDSAEGLYSPFPYFGKIHFLKLLMMNTHQYSPLLIGAQPFPKATVWHVGFIFLWLKVLTLSLY